MDLYKDDGMVFIENSAIVGENPPLRAVTPRGDLLQEDVMMTIPEVWECYVSYRQN